MYYVYLAECRDGTLYCGIAKDVEKRIAVHNSGKRAKYTRGRGPVRVVAVSSACDKSTALRFEIQVKKAKRSEKVRMVQLGV